MALDFQGADPIHQMDGSSEQRPLVLPDLSSLMILRTADVRPVQDRSEVFVFHLHARITE